jgi:glycerol-3-phosphate O-acyltransferase / dihydroxyacetone phosphate acyltransferase
MRKRVQPLHVQRTRQRCDPTPVPPDRETLSYRLLSWIAGVGVRWYYRDVVFDNTARIPRSGPVLLVVNHPNELMDAIFAGLVSPRQLTFTGKATLFDNPILGAFLRHMRVVPLRRVQDESAKVRIDSAPDASRNADAFSAIHGALSEGQMVLIFPEGRSWDEPRLAPIKTGAARIALSARESGVPGVRIVPVGINYERKDGLRSRVLVEVGEALHVDQHKRGPDEVETLTTEIARRLHAVTLNFDDDVAADEVLDVATVIASTTEAIRPLGDPDAPLATKIGVARRADIIRLQLARGLFPAATQERVRRIQRRLLSLRRTATRLGIRLDDVALDTRLPAAGRFAIRELMLAAVGIPLAAWGRMNHVLPFAIAKWLGKKTSTSRSQLAMHTVVLGALLVPLFYVLQAVLVWRWAGPWWSVAYIGSLIPSASWDIRYTERLRNVRSRAIAWRHFRDDPGLQHRLRSELFALREEAAALAASVTTL